MSLAYRLRYASLAAFLFFGCSDASDKGETKEPSGADDDDDDDDDNSGDDDDSASSPGKVDAGKQTDSGKGAIDAKVTSDAKTESDGKSGSDAKVVAVEGGADSGSGSSSGSACTGKKGSKRGKSTQNVMAGGLGRTFIYYAPEGLDPNEPVPLVILPHGAEMSGQMMYDITQYNKLADREKFVAIFPDGIAALVGLDPWNVGQNVCGLGALVSGSNDDQAFVDEMIKFASDDQCIDQDHIFMTGFSMGGYFSHETGCMNPKIRAIGPHSGGTHDLGSCKNSHKPVLVMHHTDDALIGYECGVDGRDRWVAKNGCSKDDPEVVEVKGGKCEYYKGCPADGQVAFCTFTEGADMSLPAGHAWSGGSQDGEGAFAAIPVNESATELSWAFFKKYAW